MVGKIAGSIDAIKWTSFFDGEDQMKIVIIALRSTDHRPEDFAPHLDAEAAMAFDYMEEEFYREVYSLRNGGDVLIIAEAESEAAARAKMAELPLSKAGMLNCEYIPLKAYRGMKIAANLLRGKDAAEFLT